jgi:TolB protein
VTATRFGRGVAVFVGLVLLSLIVSGLGAAGETVGDFDDQADVGRVDPPGSARFDKTTGQYTITSSGENIWGAHDDFHFLFRKVPGDLTATAEVTLSGTGNAHRKGGWMVREGLEPDAAYVDVMVHGDGLIALQYRAGRGEMTKDIKSSVKAPAVVRLERHGETFSVYAAPRAADADKPAAAFQLVGSVKLALRDPVYAGLAVTSHDAKATETAIFANVTFKNESRERADK